MLQMYSGDAEKTFSWQTWNTENSVVFEWPLERQRIDRFNKDGIRDLIHIQQMKFLRIGTWKTRSRCVLRFSYFFQLSCATKSKSPAEKFEESLVVAELSCHWQNKSQNNWKISHYFLLSWYPMRWNEEQWNAVLRVSMPNRQNIP